MSVNNMILLLDYQFKNLCDRVDNDIRPLEVHLKWREMLFKYLNPVDLYQFGFFNYTDYHGKHKNTPLNLFLFDDYLAAFNNIDISQEIMNYYCSENLPANLDYRNLYNFPQSSPFFNWLDIHTYLLRLKPFEARKKFNFLSSLDKKTKFDLLSIFYPDFRGSGWHVDLAFEFKLHESMIWENETYPLVEFKYSEISKLKYILKNEKRLFALRSLLTLVLVNTLLTGFFSGEYLEQNKILLTVTIAFFAVLFIVFGFMIDKLIFNKIVHKLSIEELENSKLCRNVWKKLTPLTTPVNKNNKLYLCAKRIKDCLHIAYYFQPDDSGVVLDICGYKNNPSLNKNINIFNYSNTGYNFWLFLCSPLRLEQYHFSPKNGNDFGFHSPEVFMIDFKYFPPYFENPLSDLLPLEGFFDLLKGLILDEMQIEVKFEKNKFKVESETNKHMQVKISNVIRFICDRYSIAIRANKTDRYMPLKLKMYNEFKKRVEFLKLDNETPFTVNAICEKAFLKVEEKIIKETYIEDQINTHTVPNMLLYKPCLLKPKDLRGRVYDDLTNNWFRAQFDENKEIKKESILASGVKRPWILKQMIESNILDEPETITSESVIKVTKIREARREIKYLIDKDKSINLYKNQGNEEENIQIQPLNLMLDHIHCPLNLEKFKKSESKKLKKRMKSIKRKENVELEKLKEENENLLQEKISLTKSNLVDLEDKKREIQYRCRVINKLLLDRVKKLHGSQCKPLQKEKFREQLRKTYLGFKKRFPDIPREYWDDYGYRVSVKVKKEIKNQYKASRENIKEKRERKITHMINTLGHRDEVQFQHESNNFKKLLLCKRLFEYGVPWKKTPDILSQIVAFPKRIKATNCGVQKIMNILINRATFKF